MCGATSDTCNFATCCLRKRFRRRIGQILLGLVALVTYFWWFLYHHWWGEFSGFSKGQFNGQICRTASFKAQIQVVIIWLPVCKFCFQKVTNLETQEESKKSWCLPLQCWTSRVRRYRQIRQRLATDHYRGPREREVLFDFQHYKWLAAFDHGNIPPLTGDYVHARGLWWVVGRIKCVGYNIFWRMATESMAMCPIASSCSRAYPSTKCLD